MESKLSKSRNCAWAAERYRLQKKTKIAVKTNFEIKYENHFKLYVLQKDQIIFESELVRNKIDFYSDIENQPNIVGGIRYFLLDRDSKEIDKIIIENEIIASTETIANADYRDGQKANKIYLIIAGIVIGIMLLIIFIDSLK